MNMTPKQIAKYKGCMSFFKAFTLTTLCLSTLTADTVFETKVFNILTQKLDTQIYKVSDSLIRVDKLKDKKKFYSVIETKEQQKYLINTERNETIKDPLHEKTTYNDKSTLELAGDGKALIGTKYSTKRYQFKAKGKVCNHIYMTQLDNPDAKVFNESFTIVPTKLAGMRISD